MGFYNNDTSGKSQIEPDKWYHVAFVYNKEAQTQQVFLNGKLDGAGFNRAPYQGRTKMYIGRCFESNYFHGIITEVRLWDVALSEEQIQSRINQSLQGNESNLRHYWPLTVGEDEKMPDITHRKKHGKCQGVTFEKSTDSSPKKETSKAPTKLLKFDESQYVDLVPATQLGIVNKSFTFECWFNIETINDSTNGGKGSNSKTLFGTDKTFNNQGMHLLIRNEVPFMGFYGNDTSGKSKIEPNKW